VNYSIGGGADVGLFMPNTVGGIHTANESVIYQNFIPHSANVGSIIVVPTMLLTEDTTQDEIRRAAEQGIRDLKVYPKERTTNSASRNGVRDYHKLIPVMGLCADLGVRVHVHPGSPLMSIDDYDAEFGFLSVIDVFLRTGVTVVAEHISDCRCLPSYLDFAKTGRFYVTITAHHLASNRSRSYGDVRSVCQPPIQAEGSRLALIELVAANHPWVMAGTDSAPHGNKKKHVASGKCACGAFTAPFAHLLYAHALGPRLFLSSFGIETYINFTSRNMRRVYNLPASSRRIYLVSAPFIIPENYKVCSDLVEPFWAGQQLNYSFG
jgi:dihydroorotase